jgi:nucleotide-binding universal stress UspA family protein/uncharacterized ParB-like nuclease family protein
LEEILARLRGKSAALLPYDEVRLKLGAIAGSAKKLQDIPLDAIVGSVGRYTDFTKSFLPLRENDKERWARVKVALEDVAGLPPIEVYQIGDYYFVLDGHHRISVARQLGAKTIQAFVTRVSTKIPFSLDDKPDEVILEEERRYFLEQTNFDKIFPGKKIEVSVPGQYQQLVEHISVHRYYMGVDQKREVSKKEALVHWFNKVYLPVIRIINERNILKNFPGRTEADLYLWIEEHKSSLENDLGWKIADEAVARDLSKRFGLNIFLQIRRMVEKISDLLTPDELENGPEPGEWRLEHGWDDNRRQLASCSQDIYLFDRIMVAMGKNPQGWNAFDMSVEIAKREGAWLAGLHVVRTIYEETAQKTRQLQSQFNEKCKEKGISGKMAVASGEISRLICDRSRWTDLVVVNLAYPPPLKIIPRLGSGFRKLIKRCPTPILAVSQSTNRFDKILLAFDGSPRAKEALYVATYITGCWNTKLYVVTVKKDEKGLPEPRKFAQDYLEEHQIDAEYIEGSGYPPDVILKAASENDIDMIIMGGYGAGTFKEIFIGSTVDRVLQSTRKPVLICK